MSAIVFFALQLLRGDPARVLLGPEASGAAVAEVRHQLGLDRPIAVQYVTYIGDAVQGDFGKSIATGETISASLTDRYPRTLALAGLSLFVAMVLGITLGTLSAFWKGKAFDYAASSVAVLGVSVPVFWLGLLLIYVFGVQLRWLPTEGLESWRGYVMPVITLVAYPLALVTRLTRASTIEVLDRDFIRTARAKGLTERRVLFVHALRNSLIPTVTAAGLSLGFLLGGTVVVEAVFNINGLGRWIVDAVLAKDIPVVLAGTLVMGCGFILANLIVDMLYGVLDPRIRR